MTYSVPPCPAAMTVEVMEVVTSDKDKDKDKDKEGETEKKDPDTVTLEGGIPLPRPGGDGASSGPAGEHLYS